MAERRRGHTIEGAEMVVCDLPPGVRSVHCQRGRDVAVLVSADLSPLDRLLALEAEVVCHPVRRTNGTTP